MSNTGKYCLWVAILCMASILSACGGGDNATPEATEQQDQEKQIVLRGRA